jgi:hypothetical protein
MADRRKIAKIAFWACVLLHWALLIYAVGDSHTREQEIAAWSAFGVAAIAIAIFIVFRPWKRPADRPVNPPGPSADRPADSN